MNSSKVRLSFIILKKISVKRMTWQKNVLKKLKSYWQNFMHGRKR